MDFVRSLLPLRRRPSRRCGSPALNGSPASASASSLPSSAPLFSFSNLGGGLGLLPGGGVRGVEGVAKCESNKQPVAGELGGNAIVSDSAIAFSKASRKEGSSSGSSKPSIPLKNTKATDYATPEKYLENPEKIPSYYVFQSNMVTDEDLKPGMLRNLEVDKRLTLPTRTHIRFLVTATDVIHSWAVPALGIKADAIPGRMQRVHAFIQREGVYYGQCSELCGSLHGFMPIVVEAVSPETYAAHAKKWYRDE